MIAIYQRELKAYFDSVTGWLCIAFLCAAAGLYFMVYNLFYGYPNFSIALYYSMFIFLVAVPILTMRSMAEERRSKTDQLLLTSPCTVTGMVLGKYFAMLTVYAIPHVIFCFYPVVMSLAAGSTGTVYFASDYASILAFFLLGAVYIAIGLLVSSLTESQVIAAVGTFGLLLLFYLWDSLLSFLSGDAAVTLIGLLLIVLGVCALLHALTGNNTITLLDGLAGAAAVVGVYVVNPSLYDDLLVNLLSLFSLNAAFQSFALEYVFDLGGLLLYVSMAFLLVFLTIQVVQRRRWN